MSADNLRERVVRFFSFLAPREEAFGLPLPQQHQDLLWARSQHYRRLPPDVRAEFNLQVQVFLTQKRVTPVKARVTGEVRLLAAASAVTLSAGWPGYTWDHVREVLIYPKDFDQDYRFRESSQTEQVSLADSYVAAGVAHGSGIVILSKPRLLQSFTRNIGAYHVGLHEFAHLLDLARQAFDGVPSHLNDHDVKRWAEILTVEGDRLESGDSVLDPYGLANRAELFAVAVEAFFQQPVEVAAQHPQLYAFLAAYFRQDPAAWAR